MYLVVAFVNHFFSALVVRNAMVWVLLIFLVLHRCRNVCKEHFCFISIVHFFSSKTLFLAVFQPKWRWFSGLSWVERCAKSVLSAGGIKFLSYLKKNRF